MNCWEALRRFGYSTTRKGKCECLKTNRIDIHNGWKMGNQHPSTFEERLYFLVRKRITLQIIEEAKKYGYYRINFLMVKVRRLSKPRQMAEGSRVGEQGKVPRSTAHDDGLANRSDDIA